ncbi:MAG: VIT family protein [Gaiellaceae bacterium]
MTERDEFVLQRVQPALVGLIDGSLSTIAPIFTVALATHKPFYAFLTGLATALAAGVSMAFSEGLSDTGEFTGRGTPATRGAITGAGTFLGGILHTLPFLIPNFHVAFVLAVIVVGVELTVIPAIRARYMDTSFGRSFVFVSFAGLIIFGIGIGLGSSG